MSNEVFVDTSAWIAVSDLDDKFHPLAREEYRRLIAARRTFLTTNLIIAEVYIIIRRTGGHAQAIRFLTSTRSSPRLQVICSDTSLEDKAVELLKKYSDQDFSYTDAVSFATMQERGIEEAFTFDSHFAVLGFRLLPVQGR